jgi:hypothetical protein
MPLDLAQARALADSPRLGGQVEYLRALLGVALAILDAMPPQPVAVEAEAPAPVPAPPAAGPAPVKGKRGGR